MSLTELTGQLSKNFDECLETILSDPQQQKEEGNEELDTQVARLKASFLEIESQLKSIRLKALGNREISVKEANTLLKRDIDIKKTTIEKYATKLDKWESEIPALIENSKRAVALRSDGTDFDSGIVIPAPPVVEDDEIIADEVAEEPVTDSTSTITKPKENNNDDDDDDDDEDDDVEFEEV